MPQEFDLAAELERLETWLASNRPDVLNSLLPPAGDSALADLERTLRKQGFPEGVSLPADLVELLSWTAGPKNIPDQPTGFFDGRDLMGLEWIAESHGTMLQDGAPDHPDQPGYYHPGWIGFLDNSYSILCVDAVGTFGAAPGNVVYVDFKGDESRPFVAPSIAAYVHLFVQLLNDEQAGAFFVTDWQTDEYEFLKDVAYWRMSELTSELFPGYPVEHSAFDEPTPS